MRKILIASFLLVASLVQAEVLSWRVDFDTGNAFYDSAQLFATFTDTVNTSQTEVSGGIARYSTASGVLTTDTTLMPYNSGIKFFVAYFLVDAEAGFSALMSWDDLVTAGSIWSGIPPAPPGMTAWNAVPEPTSIGLLAIGMSALLLRRRRRG